MEVACNGAHTQMYEILKDFAGPFSTVVAAMVAFYLTWTFSSRQAQTAQQQADTALDQLRYNLFEKRYAIYNTAKEMVKYISMEVGKDNFDASKVVEFSLTLDEACFFFSGDILEFLRKMQIDCQMLLKLYTDRKNSSAAAADHAEWVRQGEKIAELITLLVKLYSAMPARFEEELRFPQLTRHGVGD